MAALDLEIIAEFENADAGSLVSAGFGPIQLPLVGTAAAGAAIRDCADVSLEPKYTFARLKPGARPNSIDVAPRAELPEIDYGGFFVQSRDQASKLETFSESILQSNDVAVAGMTKPPYQQKTRSAVCCSRAGFAVNRLRGTWGFPLQHLTS